MLIHLNLTRLNKGIEINGIRIDKDSNIRLFDKERMIAGKDHTISRLGLKMLQNIILTTGDFEYSTAFPNGKATGTAKLPNTYKGRLVNDERILSDDRNSLAIYVNWLFFSRINADYR